MISRRTGLWNPKLQLKLSSVSILPAPPLLVRCIALGCIKWMVCSKMLKEFIITHCLLFLLFTYDDANEQVSSIVWRFILLMEWQSTSTRHISKTVHSINFYKLVYTLTYVRDNAFHTKYTLTTFTIVIQAYYKTHDQIPKRVVIKSLSHEQEHVLEPTEEDIQQTKAFLHKMVNKLQQTRAFVARPSRYG